jgi:uncharacterized protein YbbC (DUF1343 family)
MEVLLERGLGVLGSARVGLLMNQASVNSRFSPFVEEILREAPQRLRVLLSPQHGLWGEKQADMVESGDEPSTPWGLKAVSLYGPPGGALHEVLEEVDVLLVDLQDVGCRVYTFAATLKECMMVCAQLGKRVVIADRPNPVGGKKVEGNLLREEMMSLVGAHPVPMRHGLTFGELALLMREECSMDLELEIIPMEGWRRGNLFGETGLPWIPPSPNLPSWESCLVYPGQVLLEGTNLSEGRGTTRPFEIFGAPYIDPFALKRRMDSRYIEGVAFRAVYFEPTFDKWRGKRCGGLHLHITDHGLYRPYLTTLWILHEVLALWGDEFQWRKPPYEYEYERLPIDLLLGDPSIRVELEFGTPPDKIEEGWMKELEVWLQKRERFLVYPS